MTDIPEATATEATLEDLSATPFLLSHSREAPLPFIFASPHSGRIYPKEFLSQTHLSGLDIRRSEDAYADLLFDTSDIPAARLVARFPRAYIDVNRSPLEIDIDMFDGPLAFPTERTLHVVSGFGIIPRQIREGSPIHRNKLSLGELTLRIEKFYFPYHRTLSRLMKATRDRFGYAILIDCHTMPGAPDVADIVLGDRFGTSAPPALVRKAECCFAAQGFSVLRNQPYAGGYNTEKFTRPQDGLYALQIELRRDLYMDEESLQPLPDFFAVQKRISAALHAMTRHFRLDHTSETLRRAAE